MIEWKKYFDQIICLHYLPLTERINRIQLELKRTGILDSGIFRYDMSVDSPFYRLLKENINFSDTCQYKMNDATFGQFKCSYQHYEVIKKSLYSDYNRILILEDDSVFLKDLNLVADIIKNIPECDILLFDKFAAFKHQFDKNEKTYPLANKYFRKFDSNLILFSSACYALSRNAMDSIVKQQEQLFFPSDDVWNHDTVFMSNLTKMYSTVNLACQIPTEHNNGSASYIINCYKQSNVNLNKFI